jgi:hypothetical protein
VAIEEELTKLESLKSAIWMKQNKPAQEISIQTENSKEIGNGLETENSVAGEKPDEVSAVEEKSVEEASPVTDAGEAEETDFVDRSKDEAVEKAVSEKQDEQETPLPAAEPLEAKVKEAANPPDYTPSSASIDTAEKETETDASVNAARQEQDVLSESPPTTEFINPSQPASTSLSVDTASSLPSSPQGIPNHEAQSLDHIENFENAEDKEQPASTIHVPSEPIHSPAQDTLRPASPSVTVTVTDEEEEEEQDSVTHQDLAKAFHAVIETARDETVDGGKVAGDDSSDSSFEML